MSGEEKGGGPTGDVLPDPDFKVLHGSLAA
jgi:hypothetical protein